MAADESTCCLRRARVEGSRSIVKSQEIRSANSIGSDIDYGKIEKCAFDDYPPRGRRPGQKITL